MAVHPRLSKIVRDVWTSRARALVAVLSVALGVASTGMLLGARQIVLKNLDVGFRAINPSSAIVLSEPFGPDAVAEARTLPGIAQAEGRFSINVRFDDGRGHWQQLLLQGLPDYEQGRLDRVNPEAGAWPPPPDQILIERESLPYVHRSVGDELPIEMPDGQHYRLRIAGTVHDLNRFPVIVTGVPLSYVSMGTLQRLAKLPSATVMNELHFLATNPDSKDFIKQTAVEVRAMLDRRNVETLFTQIPPPNRFYLYSAAQVMMLLLTVLGIVTLLMGALLVVNTVSALLIEQTRQIGVMKSMGAGAYQLLAIYVGMVLVFGLCAVAIAIPLSMWASSIVVSYVVRTVNFNVTTLAMPGSILVLELVAGIVVPLLAAMVPVLSGCRMSIRDALASEGLGAGFGESRVDRLLGRVRVLPDAARLSLRNAFRRKGRLMLTLAALVLGGAFFIGVLSVRDSLERTTENEFHYMRYDLEVVFGGPQPIGPAVRVAQRVPGVVVVEPWSSLNAYRIEPGGTESGVVSVIAPTVPSRMTQPILDQGRWLAPGDNNALVMGSDFYSSNPDLHVGGDAILRIAGKATTWHIVGIARTRFFGIGTSSGPAVYVPARALAVANDTPDRANTLKVATTRHDAASQADVAAGLETALDRAGYSVSYTQTISAIRASRDGPNGIIVKFLISMAILLALVGGLGLAGTMSINVLERIRELGVMRSIGAGQTEIFQIVLVEGIVIGLLGWLIGTLLSVPVSSWLSDLTSEELLSQPPNFAYAISGVGLWLAIVVGLAAVATAAPAWRATRITIRVALAYE